MVCIRLNVMHCADDFLIVDILIYWFSVLFQWQVKTDFESTMFWPQSEVHKPEDKNLEPCCDPGCTPFPECCRCHSDKVRPSLDHPASDGHLHWTEEYVGQHWRSKPLVQVQERMRDNNHRYINKKWNALLPQTQNCLVRARMVWTMIYIYI